MSGDVRYEPCGDPERLAAHRAEHGDGSVEVNEVGETWRPTINTNVGQYRHCLPLGYRYRLVHPEPDYPIVWVDGWGEFELLASVENLRWVRRPGDPRDYGFVVGAHRVTTQPPTRRVQWWEALRDGCYVLRSFDTQPRQITQGGPADGLFHRRPWLSAMGHGVDIAEDDTVEVLVSPRAGFTAATQQGVSGL